MPNYQYDAYDPGLLNAPPRVSRVGRWRVDSISFCLPGLHGARPLVLVGGAFQTYWSFRAEIEHFVGTRPVVVIHLPGQGANPQDASELTLDDLADVLEAFFVQEGYEDVSLIGVSYGGGIAHKYAVKHPERLFDLILGGIGTRIPAALEPSFRTGYEMGQTGDVDTWSQLSVLFMANRFQSQRTGYSHGRAAKFAQALASMGPTGLHRAWVNSRRGLDVSLEGAINTRLMVFALELDHFIPASLAVNIAEENPHATFALFLDVDHLIPLQRPDRLVALYEAFLDRHDPLQVEGVLFGDEAHRYIQDHPPLPSLTLDGELFEWRLADGASGHGAALEVSPHDLLATSIDGLPGTTGLLTISFPSTGFTVRAHVIERDASHIRLRFFLSRFEEADAAFAWFRALQASRTAHTEQAVGIAIS